MKPKFRNVLEMAIEEGVRFGYNRAFKHNLDPDQDDFADCVVTEIMNSLDSWFNFDDNTNDF